MVSPVFEQELKMLIQENENLYKQRNDMAHKIKTYERLFDELLKLGVPTFEWFREVVKAMGKE